MIVTKNPGKTDQNASNKVTSMYPSSNLWASPAAHLQHHRPDHPVYYFMPEVLQNTARRFIDHYPGLVSYAVKANDADEVLENLASAGIRAFDVASVAEMHKVLAACPDAVMHYHNPVRSSAEIRQAHQLGVRSFSVDSLDGLDKLAGIVPPDGVEVSVRLKLPVEGAKYHFGSKFGADPALTEQLLQRVQRLGFTPSITFHPGTQCADPAAWTAYIAASADICQRAGVSITRLNTGGGYAASRTGQHVDLERIFTEINHALHAAFPQDPPQLVCEPGRAMVADAFILAAQVKAIRSDGAVYLNDGIYGSFAESPSMGTVERISVISPDGTPRTGLCQPRVLFGPTCDSLDQLPDRVDLPDDLAEEDYVLFAGMGAYALATVTRFNGYGAVDLVTIGAGQGG